MPLALGCRGLSAFHGRHATLLLELHILLPQRGADLALVFADGLVVIRAGAELGGFGADEFFLLAEHFKGRAGAGFEAVLAGVEADLGEAAGLGGGDDALARGDDLAAGVIDLHDDLLLERLERDEGLGSLEFRGVGFATPLAVGDRDADDRADGPRRLVARADAAEAGAVVVVEAEKGEAAEQVEAGQRVVLGKGDGDVAALDVEERLAVVGAQFEGLAEAGGHIGAEGW